MCNHDDNKINEYLEVFDFLGYEIYICECGALINSADIKNYDDPISPMNKQDIDRMMEEIMHPIIRAIDDATAELQMKHRELRKIYGE